VLKRGRGCGVIFIPCLPCRTEETLGELLKEIQQHPAAVRFDAMANIIAVHCQSESEFAQVLIVEWGVWCGCGVGDLGGAYGCVKVSPCCC